MLCTNSLKQCLKWNGATKWGKFIENNVMQSTLMQINLIVRSILSNMGTTKEYGKWIEIHPPYRSLIENLSSFSMELDMHKKKFHSTVSIFYVHVTHCKLIHRFIGYVLKINYSTISHLVCSSYDILWVTTDECPLWN